MFLTKLIRFETVTENYVKYENSLELPQITICGEGPEYLPLYLDFCTFDRYHDCLQNYQTVDILHRDGSISKCMHFNGGKNSVGTLIDFLFFFYLEKNSNIFFTKKRTWR